MTDEQIDLSGKLALITGASRGIGRAVAKAYAKAGAHVILVARTTGALEELDDEIRAEGGQATLIPLDLRDFDKVDMLGPAIAEKFGKLDIFVGNAGLLGTLGPLGHADAKEFERVMQVNVTANFRLIRTLDPLLRAADNGRAIFVSTSQGAVAGRAYWGVYSISKAALESMMRTYADETTKTNVKVNAVNPGAVRTKMRAEAMPGEDPETIPAPEDIVDTFLQLAANDCVYHGQVINAQ